MKTKVRAVYDTHARPYSSRTHGYAGDMLGDFRIGRAIASFGTARVYLGHKPCERGGWKLAAVKVIPLRFAHATHHRGFVEKFFDEARGMSCILHPNVGRVIDFGQRDDACFLATDYVLGETWADVLARMGRSRDMAHVIHWVLAQVLAQACEGLHAAHEATDAQRHWLRIVHRGVSPQNVMVGYDGNVRVLDFGMASAAGRFHIARHGVATGRRSYTAPEQMRGAAVDHRADVWSLGVMLWEGLTGRALFSRSSEAETELAVTCDPVLLVAEQAPHAPPALQRIAARALQRDVGARYASAREMGLELSHWASTACKQVGSRKLSECMHRLFADELLVKRALLRRAAKEVEQRAPATDVPRVRSGGLEEGLLHTRAEPATHTPAAVRADWSELLQERQHPTTLPFVAVLLLAAWLVVALAESVPQRGANGRAASAAARRRESPAASSLPSVAVRAQTDAKARASAESRRVASPSPASHPEAAPSTTRDVHATLTVMDANRASSGQ